MAQAKSKEATNQSVASTPRGDAIARYVHGTATRQYPPEVIEAAKKNFVDFLGVAVGSYYEAPAMAVRKTALSWGATGKAQIFLDQQTTPALAGLVNGTMAHCMDYDDGHPGGAGHSSAPLCAATLALSGHLGLNERDTLAGYITGFEVMTRLGGGFVEGVGRNTARRGFHPTAIYGTSGVAAAAGALMKLSEQQAAYAMGVAATTAGGLVASFGSHSKPFHAGQAAMDGIHAAQLASNGFQSATHLFELEKGLLDAIIQDKQVKDIPPMEFDGKWEILGNAFKPYACCRATHASVQAARTLAAKIGDRKVKRVHAKLYKNALFVAGKMNPKSPLECKFSVPFTISMGLRNYALAAPDFSYDTLKDEAVTQIVPLVECEVVENQLQGEAHLDVWLEDGEHLHADTAIVIGHPDNPMSWDDMHAKFMALVKPVIGAEKGEQLYTIARNLDQPGSMAKLFAILGGKPLPPKA
jgi:2-methylcitrate dehydratase PrpD